MGDQLSVVQTTLDIAGQLDEVSYAIERTTFARAHGATSIHVYSPPITSMTYYDPDTFEPVETESVVPEPQVLGSGASSYVLHPSRRLPS